MFTWSKGWCKTLVQLFTTDFKEKHFIEKCLECPALLKGKQSAMLIHVDDVLMCCDPRHNGVHFFDSEAEVFCAL
jgi:hypothetical protein